MALLEAGNRAPNFELSNDDMHLTSLSDFAGKKTVVLYFYPKDDTPGCTTEAIEFTTHQDAFEKANTVVLGVSRDDCVSHAAFKDKHGLTVMLLPRQRSWPTLPSRRSHRTHTSRACSSMRRA